MRVATQLREAGDVRVKLPAVRLSVPVRVQLDPAVIAVPQAVALAVPGVRAMRAGARPPVRNVRAASMRRERRIAITYPPPLRR